MNRTRIEWVKNPDGTQGYSWNPIKGLCPAGCDYCYAARQAQRWGWDPETRFDWEELYWAREKLPAIKTPRGIFVCSTFDLFHDITNTQTGVGSWRDLIFRTIQLNPIHRFYVLTKFPWNIDRLIPPNVWLGITLTGGAYRVKDPDRVFEIPKIDMARLLALERIAARVKFISYEPLLAEPMAGIDTVDWIIVGRMTGHGRRYDPPRDWIEKLVRNCREGDVKIFLKNNLREIWSRTGGSGPDLIQEIPEWAP